MRLRAWSWWAALVLGAVRARELDPAACAPRFDVQRDKIIRTEESRDMGARYLSELDVGARHECLRLCCETDSCDVFVYEEKGPGSCYLFNCGPPEDFRCKFTAHSNFSSGVLAISRRLAELQDQERLAHHEQELANLRSGATSSTASTAATSTGPPPPPPRPTPPPDPERAPSTSGGSAPRCSRYQFACRRGGECIAVYNACDGVPQCADASDEAPELGCPPAPAPPPPPAREPPARSPAGPAPPSAPAPVPLLPTLKPQQHQPLQESVEAATGEGGADAGDAAPERWPHRLTQAQPQHRAYSEGPTSSHIFSHKGGLLQEPESSAQFAAFEPPWPRRAWPPPPPHQPPPLQPPGMEGMSAAERGWGAYWPEPEPRRAWPVPRPEQEIPVYIPSKTMPEVPVVYSSQQQTLRDSPKKGFELLRKEATDVPPAGEAVREHRPLAPHDNNTNNKLVKQKTVQTSKPSEIIEKKVSAAPAHAHYSSDEYEEHDGLSEHPPAAMMLLVLGVAMSCVLAGALCRARAGRRRRARGKTFAHDADYLVNGMYL